MATKSPAMSSVSILSLCCVSRRRVSNAHPDRRSLLPASTFGVQNDIAIFDFIRRLMRVFQRAETVTAMDKVHFRSDVGQIKRFFSRVVPPPIAATFLIALKKPSQVAQAETPRPLKRLLRWRPRWRAEKRRSPNDQRITSVLTIYLSDGTDDFADPLC